MLGATWAPSWACAFRSVTGHKAPRLGPILHHHPSPTTAKPMIIILTALDSKGAKKILTENWKWPGADSQMWHQPAAYTAKMHVLVVCGPEVRITSSGPRSSHGALERADHDLSPAAGAPDGSNLLPTQAQYHIRKCPISVSKFPWFVRASVTLD